MAALHATHPAGWLGHGVEAARGADVSEAVRRRFGAQTTRAEIIRWVARSRIDGALAKEQADALVAERLLLGGYGDREAVQGLADEDTMLIGPLLADLVYDDAEGMMDIEALLADARAWADRVEAHRAMQ